MQSNYKEYNREKPACAALLHDFSTMVTRQLAESIIAVDNRPIHNLGIPQNKIGVCQEEIKHYFLYCDNIMLCQQWYRVLKSQNLILIKKKH